MKWLQVLSVSYAFYQHLITEISWVRKENISDLYSKLFSNSFNRGPIAQLPHDE